LAEKESTALEALKELRSKYVQSVWNDVEAGFNVIDKDKLELGFLGAERISKKGWLSAGKAQQLITEWEQEMRDALNAIDAVPKKLAEVKRAQRKCTTVLAGLNAAFEQAQNETAGNNISTSTRKDLERTRQIYIELSTLAQQPADTIDWIVLCDQLAKLEAAVEKVSKDAVRDKGIAEKIRGQDPDELLAKMKRMLDSAEEKLGKSDAARGDLDAGWENYEIARKYHSEGWNEIDVYLMMNILNNNIQQGQKAVEEANRAATAVHHTGFGSSGSGGFGGGRIGGGSRGGGKW
jgi:hypothetical protein